MTDSPRNQAAVFIYADSSREYDRVSQALRQHMPDASTTFIPDIHRAAENIRHGNHDGVLISTNIMEHAHMLVSAAASRDATSGVESPVLVLSASVNADGRDAALNHNKAMFAQPDSPEAESCMKKFADETSKNPGQTHVKRLMEQRSERALRVPGLLLSGL